MNIDGYRQHNAFAFLALLLATCWLLWPGLEGGFLFDDYPNFRPFSEMGGINNADDVRTFVFGGSAGPTGRPLSLLSFLIEDNAWPSNPKLFKYTNLLLHLLNGALLSWAGLLLARFYGFNEKTAQQIALLNAAIWLLHPFFVSTVFYIVQRMALLATVFVLAGITCYLYGRLKLPQNPRSAYLWMGAGIGLGSLLGILSKENAALLPLLILVIEFCSPRKNGRPNRYFQAVFLWLPSIFVIVYLLSLIDLRQDIWPNRPFDQVERLLTQPRVLWDYIGNLLIPRIENTGLYQDNLVISTGWLSPVTTLVSAIGLALLTGIAITIRKKAPLLSLAILFFLAGHLIESSVIGLELYFEHRNYLPAVFFFLPLGQGLIQMNRWGSPTVIGGIALSVISLLGFMAHQRASLWGNPIELKIYWALANPDSPRAQNSLAAVYFNLGDKKTALRTLEEAAQRAPQSALLNISRLRHLVVGRQATPADFMETAKRLRYQSFSVETLSLTQSLINQITSKHATSWQLEAAYRLLEALEGNPAYKKTSEARQLLPYLKGKLDIRSSNPDKALAHFLQTLQYNQKFKVIMLMVAELAGGGHPEHASSLLQTAVETGALKEQDKLFSLQPSYSKEIHRIRQLLLRDLRKNVESVSDENQLRPEPSLPSVNDSRPEDGELSSR